MRSLLLTATKKRREQKGMAANHTSTESWVGTARPQAAPRPPSLVVPGLPAHGQPRAGNPCPKPGATAPPFVKQEVILQNAKNLHMLYFKRPSKPKGGQRGNRHVEQKKDHIERCSFFKLTVSR